MRTLVYIPTAGSLLMLLASCASTGLGSALGGTGITTQTINSGNPSQSNVALNLVNTGVVSWTIIAMPINDAWTRLDAAYAFLGIKLTDRDSGSHLIGNASFKARRKIGDVLLAGALDCGGTSGAPNSETYDLILGIRSKLSVLEGNRVQLETFVEGVGLNPLTNNSVPMKCSSMGVLERRIADLVRDGPPPARKQDAVLD